MLETILVPLDGSERAELVLAHVERLLRRKDSKVLFLRVVPLQNRSGGEERNAAQKYIDGMIRRYAGRGARVGGRVVAGAVADSILKAVERESATLIALTTHGRSGLSRWLLGSIAEKVVRASTVPVLLVRSFRIGQGGEVLPVAVEAPPFRKILVPTDGSRAADAAVIPVIEFARLFDSEILVLHAEVPFIVGGAELAVPNPAPTPSSDDETTAGMAESFRGAGIRVTRQTVLGDPAAVILDQSASAGANLIAMATHGRSGVSRWVLGSIAEQVLRHGTVPVLLVPGRASKRKAKK